jgi:signal transduction histidine kinase
MIRNPEAQPRNGKVEIPIKYLTLLVVDDEAGMRSAIHRSLQDYVVRVTIPDLHEEAGFTITEAEGGEEALQIIDRLKPDILLLDHKLPGMSGLDVLRKIYENRWDVVPIMITAYASIETAVNATKLGAYDFLAKPFTPGELKTVVYRAAKYRMLQRRAAEFAREKRRVRLELVSVVSHELKSPLAAVEGYLNILKDRSAGDDPNVYKGIIERSLIRIHGMRKLILDLLDLARIESGEKRRRLETIDVVESARAAVANAAPDAAAKAVTLRMNGEGAVSMTADRNEIAMILDNLISNGIKYNREGGAVDVGVFSRDGGVVVQVSDTGFGLNPEEAARIFEEFVRIRTPKTEDIPGSGLGLAIVKKIVGLYDGSISLDSRPEKGSTFTVMLKGQSSVDGSESHRFESSISSGVSCDR